MYFITTFLNRLYSLDLAYERLPLVAFALIFVSQANATQVIGNWDVIPGQRLGAPFKAGVVAFHETGVNVDFQIADGPVVNVDEPTWNDRTGLFEYWIEIDPAVLPDGPFTLSAALHPDDESHESRVLEDLPLYANAGGTMGSNSIIWVDVNAGSDSTGDGTENSPYASIAKGVLNAGDGGTVYLKAGDYKLTAIRGAALNYWTTVMGAPGLNPEDVQILTRGLDSTSTARYMKNRIRWHNLSLYCERSDVRYATILHLETNFYVWLDGVNIYDKTGPWNETSLVGGSDPNPFYTDTHIYEVTNAPGRFHRNIYLEKIGADVYRGTNNLMAANVTVNVMDRGDNDFHPDFIQFHNPGSLVENLVFYNMKAYDMSAQGIFGGNGFIKDVAFVNFLMEKDPPESDAKSQISDSWDHALLFNATVVDQTFLLRDTSEVNDFLIRNGVFSNFTTDNRSHPSITIDSIHTRALSSGQYAPLGTNATQGAVSFVDESTDDYRLMSDSPAYGTGFLNPDVPADVDGYLFDPEAPNRGAFAKSNPGQEVYYAGGGQIVAVELEAGSPRLRIRLPNAATQRFEVEVSSDLLTWESRGLFYADPDGDIEVLMEGAEAPGFVRLTPVYFPFPNPFDK